jgi:hypothetical protein
MTDLIEVIAEGMKPEAFDTPDYVGGETLNMERRWKWERYAKLALHALDAAGYAVVPKDVLLRVLDEAASNLYGMKQEFAVPSTDDMTPWEKADADIDALKAVVAPKVIP